MLGRIAMVAGAAVSITMVAGAQAPDTLQRDTTLHVKGLKNPQLAEVLGVFPGGGLMYAGAWGEGIGTYFGTVGGIGGGAMTIILGENTCPLFGPFTPSCTHPRDRWLTRTLGGAMIAAGFGVWGYQAVHAGRIVRRDNARKIAAARDTTRATAVRDVHAYVAPTDGGRSLALGVHATW